MKSLFNGNIASFCALFCIICKEKTLSKTYFGFLKIYKPLFSIKKQFSKLLPFKRVHFITFPTVDF